VQGRRVSLVAPILEPLASMDTKLRLPPSNVGRLILLLEDDSLSADAISTELKREGFETYGFVSKADGLRAAVFEEAAIVIMACPLQGEDTLDIVRTMRERGSSTPVVIISPLDSAQERIRGLRAGADDYLTKPFAVGELAARIDAILRRTRGGSGVRARFGPLEIDRERRLVWRDGRRIELFPREFEILEYFLSRPGEVVTREELLKHVWRYSAPRITNTVDVHLSSLRRKLDADAPKPMLVNIRRAGYALRLG
jgi:two-component system, OmpR family, response regulator